MANVVGLTTSQLRSISTSNIVFFETSDIGVMRSSQIASFSSTQVATLSTDQLRALTSANIVSLDMRGLTTAKLGWSTRMHNPHLRKWLHRIKVPSLIIWGDDDQVLPVACGAAYRDLIPSSSLEVFAQCGHLPHVEKAQEFCRKLLDFTQGVAS